ncbi:Cell division protein FtsW [hydrothermal vent metagenome]|uniref:Cell division protein FtsW n=1 Tax=hydrothermal vent metagenome TaxID=652676 RepID=A0A3B0WCF5_9ZZZZ
MTVLNNTEVSEETVREVVWKDTMFTLAILLASLGLLIFISFDSLSTMVYTWDSREEYSHGYLIPFITAFLLWQRKDLLEKEEFSADWIGVLLAVAGSAIVIIGNISATHVISLYGFLITLVGITYAYMGSAARIIVVPILFLFFMIPLPGIFLFRLSSELQLISSQIGVEVIRLFDISVFLEGNVIDLGKFKLQVVEACSGLRYLFPLLSLSFIAAYFFSVAYWKRIVIVVSSIPITIFMNSFRIGVIGVLVEYYGIEQAEGFLHDFEGWVVFMFSIGLILLEMWLILILGKDKRSFDEVFGIYYPAETPENASINYRKLSSTLIAALSILTISSVITLVLGQRADVNLERKEFSQFPMQIGEWEGREGSIPQASLDLLKLDDYIVADYQKGDNSTDFYVAYYDKQETGGAAHSPKTCLPGGGWRILSHTEITLENTPLSAPINRFVIGQGEHKQLVYYWFQQRGKTIASEYAVKWHMLVDSIKDNRTDGALVRLTTLVPTHENIEVADKRLLEFAQQVTPVLQDYIPD